MLVAIANQVAHARRSSQTYYDPDRHGALLRFSAMWWRWPGVTGCAPTGDVRPHVFNLGIAWAQPAAPLRAFDHIHGPIMVIIAWIFDSITIPNPNHILGFI